MSERSAEAAGPSGNGSSSNNEVDVVRKVRVRKLRGSPFSSSASASTSSTLQPDVQARMDRRIAEIIPGLAELSVSGADRDGALAAARSVREQRMAREAALAAELRELGDIYDLSVPNPVDELKGAAGAGGAVAGGAAGAGVWKQQLRAKPRRVVLSPYQYEMINYQRMLLRKNIWYYR